MKVAPVSADLLIKIGLGLALLGAGYLAYRGINGGIHEAIDKMKQSVTGVFDSITAAPGQAYDWAVTETQTRGAAIQAHNAPQSQEMQDLTGRTYSNPLMTNDGMDFGQLSG